MLWIVLGCVLLVSVLNYPCICCTMNLWIEKKRKLTFIKPSDPILIKMYALFRTHNLVASPNRTPNSFQIVMDKQTLYSFQIVMFTEQTLYMFVRALTSWSPRLSCHLPPCTSNWSDIAGPSYTCRCPPFMGTPGRRAQTIAIVDFGQEAKSDMLGRWRVGVAASHTQGTVKDHHAIRCCRS